MGFWSTTVHQLFRHLEVVGFEAPRLLGVEEDVEILGWIEGESGADGWAKIVPEAGLRRWAAFLRRYHDAVGGYRPSADAVWSSGRRDCGAGEVVCHGDFGTWNGIWRGDEIVGLIDFDHARPAPPTFDIAYALECAAPFRDDAECTKSLRYPIRPDRLRRIEVFCDAYGIAVPDDIVQQVADQQRLVHETCQQLSRQGIEPQATWLREGYDDVVRARIEWTESFRL